MKKFNKAISLLCAFAMVSSLTACGNKDAEPTPEAGIYTPGTYSASVQGFNGAVEVTVEVDANSITDVTIVGTEETAEIGGKAMETMAEEILTKGEEVDTVANATFTSTAVKEALSKALAQARGEEKNAGGMTAGTYTATAKGKNELTVSVTLSENAIESVEVTDHTETYGLGYGISAAPIETIPAAIVANQSLAVDSVASATLTSAAIKTAVADCIAQAGGDSSDFMTPVEHNTEDETYTTSILVVGAGAAGLAAAVTAQEAGADVLVMEKTGVTGGSTSRSGGKILAAGTKWQEAQDQQDSAEMMYEFLMSYDVDGLMNADLVKQFCDNSLENIMWLSDRGVQVQDVEPIHSSLTPWRVHNTQGGGGMTDGIGGQITAPLTNSFEENGGKILYNCEATKLLTDENGAVIGVEGKKANGGTVTVKADNVILATGGFAHSEEYLEPYKSFLPSNGSGVPTTNVGDGLRMATEIGAKYDFNPGMQLVYVNYDCYIGIAEESGLIVNNAANRVVNEWTYQSHVASAVARTDSPVAYYITSTKDGVCSEPYAMVQWGVSMETLNYSYKASSLDELAELAGLDAESLKATVARYNELCTNGNDEDFGKPAEYMIPVEGDTYYAFPMYPSTSVTFGGLQLNSKAQVLDTNDQPISGLYAAGEVAFGGLFSDEYPCCGMAIGSAVYFGRTAVETILGE